jgi:23S rRNA pseudouridine2605 synthase
MKKPLKKPTEPKKAPPKAKPAARKPTQEKQPRPTGKPTAAAQPAGPAKNKPSRSGASSRTRAKPFKKQPQRLNKYIAASGLCSRRKADELIRQGQVQLNGETVQAMGVSVKPWQDEVKVKGQLIEPEPTVYILVNKPKDTITTADDPQGRRTVMDIIKGATNERVYPVGRLDRNTTGLLLLTNDGQLAEQLTHPSYGIEKLYYIALASPITERDLEKLRTGIILEDGMVKADAVEVMADSHNQELGLTIHSGRNRIVRRMFEQLGYRIQKLDRTAMGFLTKRGLPRGKWRHLTPQEVRYLKMIKKERSS